MNKTFIAMCLFATALSTSVTMHAESKEKNKVIVTLNDGTTVTGYQKNDVGSGLRNLFKKTGSILSFVKVSPEEDGKKTQVYKAKDIKGYRFVNDSIEFESQDYDAQIPFKKDSKIRGLFRVEKRLPNGTIYSYLTYVTTGGRNQVSTLVTTYGVKLRGDDRIYNIIVGKRVCTSFLSRKGPKKLAEKYEEYFKDKGHCKELIDDPTLIIRLYDEYLETNPVISRSEKE